MVKKNSIGAIGLLLMGTVFSQDNVEGTSPFGDLMNSHISKGYGTSSAGGFTVTSSIAETTIGTSVNNAGGFVIHSGLLKPSVTIDLIFTNSFE